MTWLCGGGCGASRDVTVTATPTQRSRTPRGWKAVGSGALCARCLLDRYAIRAITVPVAGPVEGGWPALGAVLREAWIETTRCANWIATELYARDVRRAPDDNRLRPMPKIYLYPEARTAFPALSPINLTGLIRQVEQTYRKRRYELLWQRAVSLPTYRYPMPMPIHAQAWRLEETAGGAIIAHCRIGAGWWALRLRGGAEFARQRTSLRAILAGAALPAAGAIFARSASAEDVRARGASRSIRVYLKLVAWMPRQPARAGVHATIQTAGSDLLLLRIPGHGIVATIHGDHIRRAIRSYTVRRTRLAEDLSIVRRWQPAERRTLETTLAHLTRSHHPALRTWLQMSAAHVARVAARKGCAGIAYEDETREFCDPFPWQALRLAVQQAVEGQGMSWQYASGVTSGEQAKALAHVGSLEESL